MNTAKLWHHYIVWHLMETNIKISWDLGALIDDQPHQVGILQAIKVFYLHLQKQNVTVIPPNDSTCSLNADDQLLIIFSIYIIYETVFFCLLPDFTFLVVVVPYIHNSLFLYSKHKFLRFVRSLMWFMLLDSILNFIENIVYDSK